MSRIVISVLGLNGVRWRCAFNCDDKVWEVSYRESFSFTDTPINKDGSRIVGGSIKKHVADFKSAFALMRNPLIPKYVRNQIKEILEEAHLTAGINDPLTR